MRIVMMRRAWCVVRSGVMMRATSNLLRNAALAPARSAPPTLLLSKSSTAPRGFYKPAMTHGGLYSRVMDSRASFGKQLTLRSEPIEPTLHGLPIVTLAESWPSLQG